MRSMHMTWQASFIHAGNTHNTCLHVRFECFERYSAAAAFKVVGFQVATATCSWDRVKGLGFRVRDMPLPSCETPERQD